MGGPNRLITKASTDNPSDRDLERMEKNANLNRNQTFFSCALAGCILRVLLVLGTILRSLRVLDAVLRLLRVRGTVLCSVLGLLREQSPL